MSAAKAAMEAHKQAQAEREQARREYNEKQELENLQRVFKRLDKKGAKRIDVEDLWGALKFLGHKCKKQDVEDMIWEIDEDRDGAVSWDECRSAFYRVKHDKEGWEPRRFFNIVEFMMHDKDNSGTIDQDECMEILFRRFGNDGSGLEAKTHEFMSHDEDGDNDITFSEFLTMDKVNETARMKKHPGFRFSQALVATTKAENDKILAALAA